MFQRECQNQSVDVQKLFEQQLLENSKNGNPIFETVPCTCKPQQAEFGLDFSIARLIRNVVRLLRGLGHFGGSFLVIFRGDFAPSGVRDFLFL